MNLLKLILSTKKNLKKQRKSDLIRSSILIVYILTLFISCTKSDKVKLVSNLPEEYEVDYDKDTIKLIFKNLKSSTADTLVLTKVGKDFFEIDNNNKKLFFSTSKDTLYLTNDGSSSYKTEIERINNSSFKTSTIIINDLGKESLVSSIFYDKNYKILKIEKQAAVLFLPQNK